MSNPNRLTVALADTAGVPLQKKDRGEQGADLPGVDTLLAWPMEVGAEPEVVLHLDEQVGQPDRAVAGVELAAQVGEAVRFGRLGVRRRV